LAECDKDTIERYRSAITQCGKHDRVAGSDSNPEVSAGRTAGRGQLRHAARV